MLTAATQTADGAVVLLWCGACLLLGTSVIGVLELIGRAIARRERRMAREWRRYLERGVQR